MTKNNNRTRRFVLHRTEDASGVSGVGNVAEGVCFSAGKVALHWLSHYGAINIYDSMNCVIAIHGHEGRTKVVWLDEELP